jgi:hypothetical protein
VGGGVVGPVAAPHDASSARPTDGVRDGDALDACALELWVFGSVGADDCMPSNKRVVRVWLLCPFVGTLFWPAMQTARLGVVSSADTADSLVSLSAVNAGASFVGPLVRAVLASGTASPANLLRLAHQSSDRFRVDHTGLATFAGGLLTVQAGGATLTGASSVTAGAVTVSGRRGWPACCPPSPAGLSSVGPSLSSPLRALPNLPTLAPACSPLCPGPWRLCGCDIVFKRDRHR